MSGAHIHLLANHVPVLGSLLASILLGIALVARDRQGWARAALLTFAFAVAGAAVAFLSGEPALEAIDGAPRTSGRALQEHHIVAVAAISLFGIAAIAELAVVFLAWRRKTPYSRRAVAILLALTAASAVTVSWTGLAGGRINHPEVQRPDDREGGPAHPH